VLVSNFYNFFANRNKTEKKNKLGLWISNLYHNNHLQILKESGVLKGTCLEIGPGDGVFAFQSKEEGIKYKAVDRSKVIQEKLKEKGFNVTLASVPPLPFDDNEFDIVCMFHVLEHMPTYEQAIALITECQRVLTPDGYLVLEVPDYIRSGFSFYAWDYTHSYILSTLRLNQLLDDAGLHVTKVIEFTGAFTSPLVRLPIDLVGFVVHSRFVYWVFCRIGMRPILQKIYKTIAPAVLVISKNN
jgi:SAM-dependent methyltransferase